MRTPWIGKADLERALERNEAFWDGTLKGGPLLWVTVPEGSPGVAPPAPPAPPVESDEWTDVGYVMAKAESDIARTAYLADALPTHNPWLGPDQFAAWLGADITFKPRDNTSWVKPFIEDWGTHPEFRLDAANRWWRLYLEILQESFRRGRDRWVTCYPDLHTGIDGLAAMRGPERLMFDLIERPEVVEIAMRSMTLLWKEIVDTVSAIVLPAGQGTTNWTSGWSARRFVCLGQNDFSCLVSPAMFDRFILSDTVECCRHVDRIIYHLDGPGALQHLDRLLSIDALHCVQWIQGAGAPLPSAWLDLLRRIQAGGKTVQLNYGGAHGGNADFGREIEALCGALDPDRLFIVAAVESREKAEFIVRRAREAVRAR
jgi:hypothetical protein